MTRVVYVDSSTLLKRVLDEEGAEAVRHWMREAVTEGSQLLVTSSIAWIEVARALRRASALGAEVPVEAVELALSGVHERPITADVVSLARRIGPPTLRSLDALHLATAVVVDAAALVTHDERLSQSAAAVDLPTLVLPNLPG